MRISDWSSDVCSSDLSRCKPSKINPVVQVEVEAAIRVHMTVDQRRETTIIFRRPPPRPLRLNQYGLKHAGVPLPKRREQEVLRPHRDFLLMESAAADSAPIAEEPKILEPLPSLHHN